MGDVVGIPVDRFKYDDFSTTVREHVSQLQGLLAQPQQAMQVGATEEMLNTEIARFEPVISLLDYLEDTPATTVNVQPEN